MGQKLKESDMWWRVASVRKVGRDLFWDVVIEMSHLCCNRLHLTHLRSKCYQVQTGSHSIYLHQCSHQRTSIRLE